MVTWTENCCNFTWIQKEDTTVYRAVLKFDVLTNLQFNGYKMKIYHMFM